MQYKSIVSKSSLKLYYIVTSIPEVVTRALLHSIEASVNHFVYLLKYNCVTALELLAGRFFFQFRLVIFSSFYCLHCFQDFFTLLNK